MIRYMFYQNRPLHVYQNRLVPFYQGTLSMLCTVVATPLDCNQKLFVRCTSIIMFHFDHEGGCVHTHTHTHTQVKQFSQELSEASTVCLDGNLPASVIQRVTQFCHSARVPGD